MRRYSTLARCAAKGIMLYLLTGDLPGPDDAHICFTFFNDNEGFQ